MTCTDYALTALILAVCSMAATWHLLTIRPSSYCKFCKRWHRSEHHDCDK
jgi:hypothetical protein